VSQENVEVVRRLLEACNRRDWDAMLETGDPEIEIVTLMSGTHRGHGAWRRLVEQMAEEVSGFQFVPQDLIDVDQDRVVAVTRWVGTGGTSGIAVPDTTIGFVYTFREGLVTRQEHFRNKAEAFAAVGLEEAMSENVELVRSIYADWERGDFSGAAWADPEIEFVGTEGPTPGTWIGAAEMARAWGEILSAFTEFRVVAENYRELDDGRVLALHDWSGHGKSSGLSVERMRTKSACVFHIRHGRVTTLHTYWNRDRALADLGLAE
jgi:ketosteroid isomerase-like protein